MTTTHHESVAAMRNPQGPHKKPVYHAASSYSATCSGCGSKLHPGGRARCPAFGLPCAICGKLGHFAKVCRSRKPDYKPTSVPSTNTLSADPLLSNISHVAATDPAPKMTINITSPNGSTPIQVLPDSGAEVKPLAYYLIVTHNHLLPPPLLHILKPLVPYQLTLFL